jgi:hypothetical protein
MELTNVEGGRNLGHQLDASVLSLILSHNKSKNTLKINLSPTVH